MAKIRDGRARVSVGARSSVFAPFKNLELLLLMKNMNLHINKKIIQDIMREILHSGVVNIIIALSYSEVRHQV